MAIDVSRVEPLPRVRHSTRGEQLRHAFDRKQTTREQHAVAEGDPLEALTQLEATLAQLRDLPPETKDLLRRLLDLPDDVVGTLRALAISG